MEAITSLQGGRPARTASAAFDSFAGVAHRGSLANANLPVSCKTRKGLAQQDREFERAEKLSCW